MFLPQGGTFLDRSASCPVNAAGLTEGVPGGGGSRKRCLQQHLSVLDPPRSGPGSRPRFPQGLLCESWVLSTQNGLGMISRLPIDWLTVWAG